MDMILYDLTRLKAIPFSCIVFVLTQRGKMLLIELSIKIVINSSVDNISGASLLFRKYWWDTVHFLHDKDSLMKY